MIIVTLIVVAQAFVIQRQQKRIVELLTSIRKWRLIEDT